jgi:hypothetical protein
MLSPWAHRAALAVLILMFAAPFIGLAEAVGQLPAGAIATAISRSWDQPWWWQKPWPVTVVHAGQPISKCCFDPKCPIEWAPE